MVTISLSMIVKDEEKNLGHCLASVQHLVDEINIVDTGSSDDTKAVASRFTDRIYDFTWVHDFSKARNYSFSKATKEYIFWLDADDVLLLEDQKKFMSLRQQLSNEIDAVSMPYILSTTENGVVTNSVIRNRIVKRSQKCRWHGSVHEYLGVKANIFPSDIHVSHRGKKHQVSNRNLLIYENMLDSGKEFSPRDVFYYANECFDHKMYERAIEYYKKFLAGHDGWVEDCIHACGKLADCYVVMGNYEEAVHFVLRSFAYDAPRAEQCCRLGYIYSVEKQWEKAINWYELATTLDYEQAKRKGGFTNHSCYTWLPHLQLCVCYDRTGNLHKAIYHNQRAKHYHPTHPSILYNEDYLKKRLGD